MRRRPTETFGKKLNQEGLAGDRDEAGREEVGRDEADEVEGDSNSLKRKLTVL